MVKFLSGPENDSVPLPIPLWSHQRSASLCGFVLLISLLSGTWYYLSLEGYPVSSRSPLSSGLFCGSFLTCQNNTHSASNVCPMYCSLSWNKCVQWLLQHLVWLLSWLFCDLRSTSYHIPRRVSQEPLLWISTQPLHWKENRVAWETLRLSFSFLENL